MSFPLLRKELGEHRWKLVAILLLQAVGVAALAFSPSAQAASALNGVRAFCLGLSPLGAWAVTRWLITREYTAKTQLFLETLPVTRARVLAAKWFVGAAIVLGTLGLVIALFAHLAARHEVLKGDRLLFLSVRAGSFALLVYAVLAAVALLGRYRTALALLALFAVFFVAESTNLDLTRMGPMLLVGEDLAYGGSGLPWRPLLETWATVGGLLALAFALVLVREGSLQAMLAERMSHREKVFIGCVFVSLLVAMQLFDDLKHPEPYAIDTAETVAQDGVAVHVAVSREANRPSAHALAAHEAALLSGARDYLGLAQLPAVSIVPSAALDPGVFERAKLEERDGLVVRARFDAEGFEPVAFDAWLLRQVLTLASGEERLPEDRQWVAEGFSWWWAGRAASPEDRRLGALRERYGVSAPSWPLLEDWLTTGERLGPCIGGAVAEGALETVQALAGEARTKAFLRAALGWRSPKSVRVLWQRHATRALLGAQAQLTPQALVQGWSERLRADPDGLAAELATLPRPEVELAVHPLGSSSREARYRRVQASPLPLTLLYTELPPVNGPIALESFRHELVLGGDTDWHALPQTFAEGARLGWTASVRLPALGCSVWTGVKRVVLF